jgi:CubicO group peptidase (beta-lactamase class C family)
LFKSLKYILPLIVFSFLILNCNQTEGYTVKSTFNTPQKPFVVSTVDSTKYHDEIFRLDTLFQKMYKSNTFNGNVLIAKNNQIIYQKSFGYAIKENNTELSDSSLFQLASVSKVITGIGALLLYEQGKLKLEQEVSEILPEFPYKGITIKHLLSHRSGLPNYTYFCCEYLKNDNTQLSNQDVLDLMATHQPKSIFKQGLRFNYCNTNYAILALIIEKISGKSYSSFMQDELFKPLGMNHTFTLPTLDFMNKHLTFGYTANYKRVANDRFDGVVGDKGVYTTTHDLFLLSAALYQGKLLSKHTQEMAFAPNSPEKKQSNYGLGWRMRDFDSENKDVFHNGWWHGYRTSFHRRLKDSLTVIVLSNRLNKSVYATWRIYQAFDGPKAFSLNQESDEE